MKEHNKIPGVDSVIVSVDFSRDADYSVLIVGRKNEQGVIDICNAIQGEEAEQLYYRLLGKKANEFEKEIAELRKEVQA